MPVQSQKIILDYDDYCDQAPENCIDFLEKMVQDVPDIKVNLFAIPANRGRPIMDQDWADRTRKLIDNGNLFLGIHGLFHTHQEFERLSKDDAIHRIKTAEDILGNQGLPWIRVFKGPHWGISIGTFDALKELGYTHVFNHEDHRYVAAMSATDLHVVYYNWNLKDNPPHDDDILIAHGHTHNVCDNGIVETWPKIYKWQSERKVKWLAANEL